MAFGVYILDIRCVISFVDTVRRVLGLFGSVYTFIQ